MDRVTVERLVERGVERQMPVADLLVDEGPHLPGPGIRGKFAPLVADLIRKAETDGPFPFWGDADARADVVANPLKSIAIAFVGEDVKAGFKPICEAVSNLDGFVLRVIRGQDAVLNGLAAIDGEIAVELDHGVMRLNHVIAVDLDFVVVLSARRQSQRGVHCQTKYDRNRTAQSHSRFLKAPKGIPVLELRELE